MKATRIIASAAVTLLTLATTSTAFAGFYPADRQTYTCTTPTSCVGADHVTFNSFTNNPKWGDERPFISGSINGAAVQDRLKVKDGDVMVVRAYVHNNADATLMGGASKTVAKDVKFRLIVPTVKQADTNIIGFISASNASPAMVNDTMTVWGDNNFTLEYIKGSAEFTRKIDGVHETTSKLSDNVVTDGAALGDITGCFAYSGYVLVKVKVKMDTPEVPKTPAYSCDLLHVLSQNSTRTVGIDKFKTSQTGGATFKHAVITWGDGTEVKTDQVIGKQHTYAKDGTYTITATAHFTVNGETKTATSVTCAQSVTFTSTPKPPVTPPTTPPVTPPTEMPKTGAGNTIAVFVTVVAAGTLAARMFLTRKLTR